MTTPEWSSPLGLAVALFVAAGAFQALMGGLTAAYVASGGGGRSLLFTERADTDAFGVPATELVRTFPGVDTYRHIVWVLLGGFLLATGLLEAGLAWFGLRSGQAWALAVLAAAALWLACAWAWIVRSYAGSGAALTLGDVPPFMWVPAAIHVPAIALACVGLRSA